MDDVGNPGGQTKTTTDIYAEAGEVVTCKYGHPIATMQKDLHYGDFNWGSAVGNYTSINPPVPGNRYADIEQCSCGAEWVTPAWEFYFADGLRKHKQAPSYDAQAGVPADDLFTAIDVAIKDFMGAAQAAPIGQASDGSAVDFDVSACRYKSICAEATTITYDGSDWIRLNYTITPTGKWELKLATDQ